MEQLVDAAAEVFAEVGYDAATTNAIAARAGVSPGTLYQFFANKDALAEALSARYLAQLQEAASGRDDAALARLPLPELVDAVVDPMIAFNVANPGFQVLLADPSGPRGLTTAKGRLHEALVARLDALLAARAGHLEGDQRQRIAAVGIQLFKGVLPMVLASEAATRGAVVTELKRALRGYLEPYLSRVG